MKILFCSSNFGGGGITTYAKEVIKCLGKDHSLSVIVGDDSQNPIEEPDVEVYRYSVEDTSFQNAVNVLSIINEEIKPEIIINSCAPLITLIAPYLNDEIKLISVSHSLKYSDADIAGFNSNYSDGIIALSEHGKDHLIRKFKIERPNIVTVIPNFVEGYANVKEIIEAKVTKRPIKIIYSGGGSAVKSPDISARVLKKLLETDLDFEFVWIGDTRPPLKKLSIIKDIRALFNDDKRLRITGRLTRQGVMKEVMDANILLFPSRREGCPMALLEAWRVGIIPIVADYPHFSVETIKNNVNGFVIKHKDIDGFVDRIIDIVLNPENYTHIYYNGLEFFENNFKYAIWSERMHKLIASINLTHAKRQRRINETEYNSRLRDFNKILRKSAILSLLQENIPSAWNICWMYIKTRIEGRS